MQRIAMLSVHTSPLAALGGKKTGGMNVYVRELARELGSRGLLVDIFTRRSTPDAPEVDLSIGDNVRVIHVLAGPPITLDPDAVYPYLQQFAAGVIAFTTREQSGYDIVYSHYWLSGLVAQTLHEVWQTPFVQMFHTLGHMKNRIASAPISLGDARTMNETRITQWAARIIAATPAEQQQLVWLYRADRRKIAVIPPGVNTQRFHPLAQAKAKAQLGLPPQTRPLLFVGRIEPLKGIDTIFQALQHLRGASPHLLENVVLGIVGGDPDNPNDSEISRLRQLSENLDLGTMVHFLGAKEQALLPTFYAAAEALIMPSDYESFGMVALEAMASGTPVIATEVGGLAFLVRDGESGLLVPVRDPAALAAKIGTLLSDATLRARLGQQAAELAQQYDWARIADQILQVFETARRGEAISRRRN
ncbi:MAG: glycosyltransferase [Chloroflexi bacterium]|nr:glycosyltransferase [Chloroflexota bacterium]